MSWLSDQTGRPIEDGGHERINISIDENTRQVLDHVENKSVFIENCVRDFTQTKVVVFFDANETHHSFGAFKDAAIFEFSPFFNNCKIEEVSLSFNRYSPDGEIEFRLCINDNKGLILTESSSHQYAFSHAYSAGQLFAKPIDAMFHGKNKYIFRIQFKAAHKSEVYVKDVCLYVHLSDTPLADRVLQRKANETRKRVLVKA